MCYKKRHVNNRQMKSSSVAVEASLSTTKVTLSWDKRIKFIFPSIFYCISQPSISKVVSKPFEGNTCNTLSVNALNRSWNIPGVNSLFSIASVISFVAGHDLSSQLNGSFETHIDRYHITWRNKGEQLPVFIQQIRATPIFGQNDSVIRPSYIIRYPS